MQDVGAGDRRVQPLGTDVVRRRVDLASTIRPDRGWGAVTIAASGGRFRRAEPGGLVLEAAPVADGVELSIHGPPGTDPAVVAARLADTRAWAGLDDSPAGFGSLVRRHPVLRELYARIGDPLLSRTPRTDEAVGRALVFQLVQSEEGRRSCSQIAGRVGSRTGDGLWSWPSREQLRAAPDWTLRRCGVSARTGRSLRAVALHAGRMEEARGDWELLDRRIRALPGCGAWTSGKARLALGDPDAVPVGDYNLPALVGQVLDGEATDDPGMLALLAPFAGHRGRVLALIGLGMRRGLVAHQRRTAPHAALSAHRYW